MASGSPLTFNPVRGITEFIEVAIHTILYVRQVYPPDLFVRRKKYDTPVFQSRHPALNEYISGAVKAIAEELVLGTVDKVVVVIKNKDEAPLERFIFAVRNMIQVEAYNKDTSVENAMTSAVLGQYFRSFLIKLTMVECQLGQLEMGGARPSPRSLNPLPSIRPLTHRSCRRPFVRDRARAAGRQGAVCSARRGIPSSASILTVPGPHASVSPQNPPPWIPATPQHTTAAASDAAELHMIRAVDTGIINLSLAVQESEEKLKMLKEEGDVKGKGRAP
ncbi:hypothetical protein AcW1_000970 [Taiwanofungus camphoratus]|nr:hypothetical protein AcW1_000970 [Antrodia cinnamomea]